MREFLSIPALLLLISSCSKDEDKQSSYSEDFPEGYVRERVQTAYLNSDGYSTPQEDGTYFQFNTDASFAYHKGGAINETIPSTYIREKTSNITKLNDGSNKVHSSPAGCRFEIETKEANDDKATFIIAGGVLILTIKVQCK